MIGLCGLVATTCSIDPRKLALRGDGLRRDAGLEDGGTPELRAPRLQVSPSSIDFGRVTTGFPARARVLVRNDGDAPLPLPSVTWGEGSAADFAIIQNRCERDVAPGESCELRIQVVPAQAGALTGMLHVESVAGVVNVEVSALGLTAGDLVLAPLAGSFEDYGGVLVGGAEEGTFTLSNPGSVPTGALQIGVNRSEFSVLDPAPEDCLPGTTSLEPAQSCNVRLAFSPAERGAVDATLTVASDVAGSVSLTLAGRGLVPGLLQTSTTALDFEGVLVGQSALRTATFANDGDEPLQLSGAGLEPAAEGLAIAESDCSAEVPLEAGKSCRVQVEFRPPRAGEPLAAELVVSQVGAATPLGIPATGVGLLPGILEATPPVEGADAFGDVLLGESLERSFQIANPGAQPSGVLELGVSEGFELVTPPGPGDCVPGETTLVDGQTCSVRVRFTATERAAFDGALTVTSSLLGAVAVPLAGRGVIAGQLAAEPEVNFGRVLTAASAQRPLTITNAGDQPLAPPALELTGDPAQRAAFSFASACSEPVEPGQTCEVTLDFAPTAAVPHAADLKLTSGSSSAAVLLLGEALLPGRLTLAAAAGSSADFGDVEIGTTARRSFTLGNPGAVPSGQLSITTDDNRFEAAPGDCGQGDPAGLVDGATCTFSVAFTPADSRPVAANVSAQSPGAGRAGLQITGRGRTKATLTAAAANKDLGRAIVGQAAPTAADNEFTWALSNGGDLATGALVVNNDNQVEFAVGSDTCAGVELAGQASCQLAIRFRPGAAGPRTGRITVRDPAGMGSASVTLTGVGVALAPPGGECTDTSECAAGECTKGHCCDTSCARACESCPQGVCTPQAVGESCGERATCFGVDNCRLPLGEVCGSAEECGDGACEPRLGGAGDRDRVCCSQPCEPGQGCDAAGQCVTPTLSPGDACSGPGDARCGSELVCTRCVDSDASQCTLPGACCGSCAAGLECVEGTCQCPLGPNGSRGTPCAGACVGGDDACCPGVLACSSQALPFCDADNRCKQCGDGVACSDPALPFCDADHVCKECFDNDDCTLVPFGSTPECGADRVCRYPCAEPDFVDCNGTCIQAGTCCCSGDEVCQADGVTCAARCTPGALACNAQNGVPQVCGPDGVLVDALACPTGSECDGGECLPSLGSACAADGRCALGRSCATNGICCGGNDACQGRCQACAAGTGVCETHLTSTACAPGITCLPHDEACSDPAAAPQSPPPFGEGQCDGPDACATEAQLCRQPFPAGSGCIDAAGQASTCEDDGTGAIRCVLAPAPDVAGPGDACAFPDGFCGDGSCAVNGICCASPCGICQGCSADGSVCEDLATSPACDLITCPPQEPQCTSEPSIDRPDAPAGEGQCAAPDRCATQLDICRQPFTEPQTCLVGDVLGECQVDPLGVTSCILP